MRRILFLIILPLFIFAQCTTPNETENAEYTWSINISNGEYNQPISEVSLLVDGKSIEIMDRVDAPMENIAPAEFKNKGVPDSALLACGGFWAGYEQVLYVQKNEEDLEFILMTFEEGFAEPQTFPVKKLHASILN